MSIDDVARDFWIDRARAHDGPRAVHSDTRWLRYDVWTRGMLQAWTLRRVRAIKPRYRRAAREIVAKRIIIAVIVAIIAGIITAIQLIITEVIAKGVAAAMPTIDPLIETGTNPITWPTQTSKFTITAVQLNEAVQLSGDPGFA